MPKLLSMLKALSYLSVATLAAVPLIAISVSVYVNWVHEPGDLSGDLVYLSDTADEEVLGIFNRRTTGRFLSAPEEPPAEEPPAEEPPAEEPPAEEPPAEEPPAEEPPAEEPPAEEPPAEEPPAEEPPAEEPPVEDLMAPMMLFAPLAVQSTPTCNGLTATIWVDESNTLQGNGSGSFNAGTSTWTINGTNSNDVIVGSSYRDVIDGNNGNDTICGLAGNDNIDGDRGDDTIYGGSGNDTITGGRDDDLIYGEEGNDTITGDSGGPGAGPDIICGGTGNDDIDGGASPDQIDADGDYDIIDGGSDSGGDDLCLNGEDIDDCEDTTGSIPECEPQGPSCGDNNQDPGEECDDGNTNSEDGCSAQCVVEYCSDDIVQEGLGEECDDGNLTNGDGCDDQCQGEPYCGNNEVDPGEQCDDGNQSNGDGCSAECITEVNDNDGNPPLEDACGLDIALVLDNSNSISSAEMTQQKQAFIDFVNALDGTPTQYSVTKFGSSATVLQTFTDNTADIISAINSVNTGGGGTDWEEGLHDSRNTFDPRPEKPDLMVFASDGNPTFPNCGGSSTCPADVAAAVVESDLAQADGIRILALGIGDDLNINNLIAISGVDVDTGDVVTSDVITTDFTTMADQMAEFANQLCGGTITVNKYIDIADPDHRAGEGWTFDIDDTGALIPVTEVTTDINGQTEPLEVPQGTTYSVVETYDNSTYISSTCKDQNDNSVGSQTTNGVDNISISSDDIISCNFINGPVDYGDAPDPTYPTLIINDGANHLIANSQMYLGSSVDGETNGQPTANADGDDLNATDDEDGVTFSTMYPGGTANITVTASMQGKLDAWMDFNADGDWNDVNEQIFTNEPLVAGANALSFSVPANAEIGQTFSRFRYSSLGNLPITGFAWDGEVEDYKVTIEEEINLDFGDAPDPLYPTLQSNNGARHEADDQGLYMGTKIDPEVDGQPHANALGDDNSGLDDEDGVTFVEPFVPGSTDVDITVVVSEDSILNAWMDFNIDGDWADAGEQIFDDTALTAGSNNLTFDVPLTAEPGFTFSRFRVSTQSELSYTGSASDGEVEDYENGIGRPEVNLSIAKEDDPDPVNAGDQLTYTVTVQNAGPSNATNVVVTETLPSGVTFVSTTGCTEDPNGVPTCTLGTINAGDDKSYTITVDVNEDTRGTIQNQASVSSDETETDEDDNTVTEETLVNGYDFGDALDPTYPTLLSNDGARHLLDDFTQTPHYLGSAVDAEPDGQPDPLAIQDDSNNIDDEDGVIFNDTLRKGMDTSIDVTASNSGYLNAWIDFNNDGDWSDAGEQIFTDEALVTGVNPLTISVPLNATATSKTFLRFRFASSQSLSYSGLATDGEVEDYSMEIQESETDLVIEKTDGVTEVTPGESVTYTITVSNNGPLDITGGTVTDIFPAILSNVSWTCVSTGAADCTAGPVLGNINDTVDLPVGETLTYTVTADTDPDATGTLENTATVEPPDGITEKVPGNNTSTDIDELKPETDIGISKTDDPDPVWAGNTVVYTIQIINNGPSASTGGTFTDTIPAGMTYNAGLSDPSCTEDPVGTVTCPFGALSVGQTADFNIAVDVPISWPDDTNITNTVSIETTNEPDPDPTNDTDEEDTNVQNNTDLEITKDNGVTTVEPGESLTYTIVVTNNGQNDVVGALVTDNFPPELTNISWSCAPTGGASCDSVNGSGNLNETVDIPVGGSLTYTVDADVSLSASGSISNTATVATPNGVTDTDPSNNSATDTDDIIVVDLRLDKTVDESTPYVGDNVIFTITVNNDGPNDSSGSTVTDILPSGYTYVSDDGAGSYNNLTGEWTVGALANGASKALNITATVNASGEYNNVAEVTDANEYDPDSTPNNQEPTEDDQDNESTDPVDSADLRLDKSVDESTPYVGDNVVFTITVNNDGPSDSSGSTVTDILPSGYTYVSDDGAGSYNNLTGEWTVGALANGASKALNITATVNASGEYNNVAEVTAANEHDPDSTPNNNEPTEDDQDNEPTDPVASADLELNKTVDNGTPYVGDDVVFTITLNNNGPSDSTGSTVTDILPSGYTYVSDDGAGSYNSLTGEWTVGALTNGASKALNITATVNASGEYNNVAEVTAANEHDPDSTPNNNEPTEDDQDNEPTDPVASADLRVEKTDNPDPVAAGNDLTYTVTVYNDGPSDAQDVQVSDTLPADVTFVSTSGCSEDPNGVPTCSLGTIAAGESAAYTITVTVNSNTPAGEDVLYNTATARSTTYDTNTDNNTDDEYTSVETQTDLLVDKIDMTYGDPQNPEDPDINYDPLVAGHNLTYTVTVTNNGPSDSTGYTLTDTLPDGTTFVNSDQEPEVCSVQEPLPPADDDDDTDTPEPTNETISCDLEGLAAGESKVILITIFVENGTSGIINNHIEVNDENDTNDENDEDEEETTILVPPTFDESTKSDDRPSTTVARNEVVTYTINLINTGDVTATEVDIYDALDPDLTNLRDITVNFCGEVYDTSNSTSTILDIRGLIIEPQGFMADDEQEPTSDCVITFKTDVTGTAANGATIPNVASVSESEEGGFGVNVTSRDLIVSVPTQGDDDDDDGGGAGGGSAPIPKVVPIEVQEEVESECLMYNGERALTFIDDSYIISAIDLIDEAYLTLYPNAQIPIIKQAYTEFLKGVRLIALEQYVISGYGSETANTGEAIIGILINKTRLETAKTALTANCIEIYGPGAIPLEGTEFTDLPRVNYAGDTPITDLPQVCQDAGAEADQCNWAGRVMYTALDHEIMSGFIDGSIKPWQYTTKAEAVKIFTRATGLTPEFIFAEEVGSDVLNFPVNIPPSHWAWEYYKIGRYFEFVSDVEDFDWDAFAVRNEMFAMITRGIYVVMPDLREQIYDFFNQEDFVQLLEFEGAETQSTP